MDRMRMLLEDMKGHEVEYNKVANILYNKFGISGAEIVMIVTWVYLYMEENKEV